MTDIVTDVEILHQKSCIVNSSEETCEIIKALIGSVPEAGWLGLAAPQIGIHKRIFLAKIRGAIYAFVNPVISWTSPHKVPSIESCLSIPDVSRCVDRHDSIDIAADEIVRLDSDELPSKEMKKLRGIDAFVVQHEYDHLEGVLIIDLPESRNNEQKAHDRLLKRMRRVAATRQQKEKNKQSHHTVAKNKIKIEKEEKKQKKQMKTLNRRDKIRVQIQERYRAEKEGLFDAE